MLSSIKLWGLTILIGAVIGLSIIFWMYAHRLDVPQSISVKANNGSQSIALPSMGSSGDGKSLSQALDVHVSPSASGAVLGTSQSPTASSPTPVINKQNILPNPDNFKQYDSYKTVTDKFGYIDIQIGTGIAAQIGSKITVRYTGWLTDATQFDTTEKNNGGPVKLELTQGKLIDGWVAGLRGMKVGGVRRLIIPPALGYGSSGHGSIPANAVLVFDVILVAVE